MFALAAWLAVGCGLSDDVLVNDSEILKFGIEWFRPYTITTGKIVFGRACETHTVDGEVSQVLPCFYFRSLTIILKKGVKP